MRISDDKEFNVWVAGRLGKMREVRVMIMIKGTVSLYNQPDS